MRKNQEAYRVAISVRGLKMQMMVMMSMDEEMEERVWKISEKVMKGERERRMIIVLIYLA